MRMTNTQAEILDETTKLVTSKRINRVIVDTFRNISDTSLNNLQDYLSDHRDALSQVNIMTLFHRCAKSKAVTVHDFVDTNTIYRLLSIETSTIGSAQGIANTFYGLQGFNNTSIGTTKLLTILQSQLRHCKEIFDGQAISNMIYGLKGLTSDDPEVLATLRAIRETISRTIDSSSNKQLIMTPQGIGSAFMGLQGMSSSHSEVRDLLSILTDCIDNCNHLDNQAVANILLGLRSSSSDHHEVRQVINSLCNKIDTKVLIKLKRNELSMALWGMQGLQGNDKETQKLLEMINDALDTIHFKDLGEYFYSGEQLGPALSGLKRMSNENIEVKRLLRHIHSSILAQSGGSGMNINVRDITDQHIGSSFYGLQSMTMDYFTYQENPELNDVLHALLIVLKNSKRRFAVRSIAMGMYGLQGMSSEISVVSKIVGSLGLRLRSDCDDYTGQHIAMMLYGLKSMIHTKDIDSFLYKLSDILLTTKHTMTYSQIASAIYGLQNMSANRPAIRRIMEALAMKLRVLMSSNSAQSPPLTGQDVAMIMHGMKQMCSESAQIQSFLDVFADAIELNKHQITMTGHELSMAFNGLQNMGVKNVIHNNSSSISAMSAFMPSFLLNTIDETMSNSNNTEWKSRRRYRLPSAFIKFLTSLTTLLVQRTERLNGPMIASALYGLQGLNLDSSLVRKIIVELTADLQQCTASLDSKHIGTALYGLHNMNAKGSQIQQLLLALAQAINRSNDTVLSAQAIGNAFYGLQGMSSKYSHVRKVLEALTYRIVVDRNDPEYMLSGQNIGNALWGLRNMTSNCDEVRKVLAVLATKIKHSKAEMNGQNIGNALYSLHAMDSHHSEVQAILSALTYKIIVSSCTLSSLDIGMSLYGLRSMDSNTLEVKILLGVLLHKIKRSNIQLQLKDLSMAIIGVLQTSDWIRDDYLNVLATKTNMTLIKSPGQEQV